MATVFETTRNIPLTSTRVVISRGSVIPNEKVRFQHERIETTPQVYADIDTNDDTGFYNGKMVRYLNQVEETFWESDSPAKYKVSQKPLTYAELYEHDLRKTIDTALDDLQNRWNKRFAKRMERAKREYLAQTTKVEESA